MLNKADLCPTSRETESPRLMSTARDTIYPRRAVSPHVIGECGVHIAEGYTTPILTSPWPDECLFEIGGTISLDRQR